MKKIVLCLSLVSVFTFCKKTKSIEPAVEQPPVVAEQPDNIEYKKFEPDRALTSINGATFQGQDASGPFFVNLPVDTTASDSLTREDFPDFQFKLKAFNFKDKELTPSQVHSSFGNCISIKCSEIGDSIVLPSHIGPSIRLFAETNLIGPKLAYSNFAYVHSSGGNFSNITDTSFPKGEYYLGFKRSRNGNAYYGWIKVESFGLNGIKVKEIAINKTANKTILCGQKN